MIDDVYEKRPERRVYRYPAHLKSKPKLWLWSLRDLAVLGCMLPLSVLLAVWGGALFPLGITIGFAASRGGRRARSRPVDLTVSGETQALCLEGSRKRALRRGRASVSTVCLTFAEQDPPDRLSRYSTQIATCFLWNAIPNLTIFCTPSVCICMAYFFMLICQTASFASN